LPALTEARRVVLLRAQVTEAGCANTYVGESKPARITNTTWSLFTITSVVTQY